MFFYLLGEIFLHNLFMDCPFPCRHLQKECTLLGKIMCFFTNYHSYFFTNYARILFHNLGTHIFSQIRHAYLIQNKHTRFFSNKACIACFLKQISLQAFPQTWHTSLFDKLYLRTFSQGALEVFHKFGTHTVLFSTNLPRIQVWNRILSQN